MCLAGPAEGVREVYMCVAEMAGFCSNLWMSFWGDAPGPFKAGDILKTNCDESPNHDILNPNRCKHHAAATRVLKISMQPEANLCVDSWD